ncbi:hypothetical protein BDV95DRAFT_501944 [Massariosphaeria phaeospora]|uniref:Membrane-associated, eicosanoid/glutathione metabolism protein n=1 Tax=Massariosphaeria phaeospora TaxID=100035 RepID=A0A7C8M3S2_9PLEO|nr:hypothetical protein BDV95DRAFT_501944 [Massariosphaeria phaeospora]
MAPNYVLYSVPIYWALALWPHAYAMRIMKSANNNKFDNVNPRGSEASAKYQKAIPAAVYTRFERAEAAHKNALESAPLFIGAVLAGTVVGLPAGFLNAAIGSYLGLRIVYTALYINVTTRKYSFARTLTWAASTLLLFGIYIKAGNKTIAQN